MFRRMYKSIKAASLSSQAYDLSVVGKFSEALEILRSVYRLFGVKEGDPKAPYHTNIFYGYLLFENNYYHESLCILSSAKSQLENENYISRHDKEYLSHYCNLIICYCAKMVENHELLEQCQEMKQFNASNLHKVKSRIKQQFPLNNPG